MSRQDEQNRENYELTLGLADEQKEELDAIAEKTNSIGGVWVDRLKIRERDEAKSENGFAAWTKELDKKGESLRSIGLDEKDSARLLTAADDIWAFLFDKYRTPSVSYFNQEEKEMMQDAHADAILGFVNRLKKGWFDPSRGVPLSHFALSIISDLRRWEFIRAAKKRQQQNSLISFSLDQSFDDDEDRTFEPPDPTTPEDLVNARILAEKTAVAMASMVINFKQHYPKAKNGETELARVRMWFSERLEYLLKYSEVVIQNRREVEQAADFCYYDYYLQEDFKNPKNCDIKHVEHASLKSEIRIPGQKGDELNRENRFWLPLSVPVGYWLQVFGESVNAGRFTESRKTYWKTLLDACLSSGIIGKETYDDMLRDSRWSS